MSAPDSADRPPDDRPPGQPPSAIGRFEVRAVLGFGGMGIVYAAWDPVLQRDVAVKLLRRDRVRAGQLERASELLRREAQTAARLAHPNVVTIFDVGEHDGSGYVAMELVQGPALSTWLAGTPRTWREVLNMFFHAGRGLAAAHGVGLLHRDFKPANVLVGPDHRPRVVDFGLAHFGEVPAAAVARAGDHEIDVTNPGRAADLLDASVTLGDGRVADVLASSTFDASGSGVFQAASTGVFEASTTGTWEVSRSISDVFSTGHGEPGESLVRERVDVTSSMSFSSVSLVDGSIGGLRSVTGELGGSGHSGDPGTTFLCVGTPAYMAPELFTGVGADARTDQFAYCVALYEGLYGERPFAGETAREIAHNVMRGIRREPPSRTRVPGWLHTIVVRGLEVDPAERHASINSLLASIAFTSRIMFGD